MSHFNPIPRIASVQKQKCLEGKKLRNSSVQLDTKTRLRVLIRLGRLEYMALALMIPIPVYLGTCEFNGLIFWSLLLSSLFRQLFTSYANFYTDQVEDRVNMPECVKLCEMVGYENIKKAAYFFMLVSWLWSLIFVLVANFTVALIHLVGMFFLSNYSLGIRCKRHFLLMGLEYALSPILEFALVWTISEPLSSLHPLAFILSYEMVVLSCTLKNLPDAAGDHQAGRKSLFTDTANLEGIPRFIAPVVPFIWFSSYGLILLLILFKILEFKYLIAFVNLPLAIYGARWMLNVRGKRDKEELFRYAYFYRMFSTSALMLIFAPMPTVLITLIALIAYSQIASYLMDKNRFKLGRFYTR